MKNYLIRSMLLYASLNLLFKYDANAQITLDAQIDSSAYPALWRIVQISPTETKYFFPDTVNNTFSLLNMDFTPFITNISVPSPWAWTTSRHYEAYYITRDLFDCDTSNIEFVFAAPTSAMTPFRIMRTDGTILLQVDSAVALFCGGDCGNGGSDFIPPIINTSAGAKLVLAKFNSGNEVDYIYSLCGNVPEIILDLKKIGHSYINVFPNPATSVLKFQINLPDNINEYELLILDNNGKQVNRISSGELSPSIEIDIKEYSAGSYIYSLCNKKSCLQSGKFIITK